MHPDEETTVQTLEEELPAHPSETDPQCPDEQPVHVGEEVWYTLSPRTAYPAGALESRPAKVVKVWSQDGKGNGCCNLVVFTDGSNDIDGSNGVYWATSVTYSREPAAYRWHR